MLTSCLILAVLHESSGAVYGPVISQSWTRTTNIRFSLGIRGRGLSSSDTIRLVAPGHSCIEDSGDVVSAESTIEWNCPDIGEGCAPVRVSPPIDIPLFTPQWDCLSVEDDNSCSGAVGISSVTVDSSTGIVRISFNDSVPLVNGSFIRIGSGLVCGPSCSDNQLYLMQGGTTDTTSSAFNVGNRVSVSPLDPPGTFQILIPAFAVQPPPQFVMNPAVGAIDWYQTDSASTRVELIGRLQRSGINVCWNGQGKPNGYTMSAGSLSVVDAGVMTKIGLYPITRAAVSTAVPIILAFTTSPSSEYINKDGVGGLVLSVPNPFLLKVVDLRGADLEVSLDPSSNVCGKIMLEVWSQDETAGFPMPTSCWVNVFEVNGTVTGTEIHMIFNRGNWLEPNTDYQIVVNAVLNRDGIDGCGGSNCPFILLQTIRDTELSPFLAIETGFASSVFSAVSPGQLSTSFPYIINARIEGGVNGLLNLLVGGNTLQVTLTGGLIEGGNYIRLIFPPYTQWRLSSVCLASIVLLPGDVGYQGPLSTCTAESVVPGAQLNVISLQLPVDLPAVTTNTQRISIAISGIVAPSTGFFPKKIGVEISDGGSSWNYTEISSARIWKFPDASVAQIVREDLLTDFTFVNDSGVVLYAAITTGITIESGMSFSIALPSGWQCVSASAPAGTESFWSSFPYPSGGGELASATWTVADNTCMLSLNSGFQIYAYSEISVAITANVAEHPMSAETSIFSFTASDGNFTYTHPFSAVNDSLFVSSVSVLGSLSRLHAEPINVYTASIPGIPSKGGFAFFFTPQQNVMDQGFVRISFPPGYTVTAPCTASNLFDYIYAIQEETSSSVNRLPGLVQECTTVGDSFVWIEFQGSLIGGSKYAFALNVTLPVLQANDTAALSVWQIRTANQNKDLVDGNRAVSVPLIENLTDSFAPFVSETELHVSVSDWTPFSLSNSRSNVTLDFSVPSAFSGPVNARLTLPSVFRALGSIETVLSDFDWNSAISANQTSLPNVVLLSGVQLSQRAYSIVVPVEIPDRPPVDSLFKFRLEFGYDKNIFSQRLLVAPSSGSTVGPVRGLDDAVVEGLNLIANQSNDVRIQFRSHAVSAVITIGVPAGFSFDPICQVVTDPDVENSVSMANFTCQFLNLTTVFLTRLEAIPAGLFSFYIAATNPPSPSPGIGATFVITTYSNNSVSEVPVAVSMFPVTRSMGIAGFVNSIGLTRSHFEGRDDRPNYRNSFVLFFTPILANASELFIRAPAGFIFDPNCLPRFSVDPTQVFGSGIPWPPNYQLWPSSIGLFSCIGSGNTAKVAFTSALLPLPPMPYAMRVGVESNPAVLSPVDSQWQITLDSIQSATPFQSFPLWTFAADSNVTFLQAGASQRNLVTVNLIPFNSVSRGTLIITVPEFFSVPLDSCDYLLVSGQKWSGSCARNASCIFIRLLSLEIQFYSFSFLVLNPAFAAPASGKWIVQSFSADDAPLDESRLASFPILPSPTYFNISNFLREGLITIPALRIDTRWAVDISQNMELKIQTPLSMTFSNFGARVLLNGTANASVAIACDSETARIVFLFTVARNTSITLISTVVNPPYTPNSNFFLVSLENTLAQGSAAGWPIVPQVSNVSVVLAGPPFAAGSLSEIDFLFTASGSLDEIELVFVGNFVFPSNKAFYSINVTDVFGVTQSVPFFSVSVPLINSAVIAFPQPLAANSFFAINVSNVRLSDLSGPVTVSIVAKRAGVTTNSRIGFPAFSLPGLTHVAKRTLTSNPQLHALSLLSSPASELAPFILPRTGEQGYVNFTVFFDLSLDNTTLVILESPTYLFTNSSNVSVLSQPLPALQQVAVGANVVIPSSIGEGLAAFSITSAAGLPPAWPSNTNDASTSGFAIVYPLEVTLSAPRTPPEAQIKISLVLTDIGPVRTYTIILVAPQGYSFPANCIVSSANFTASCSPGQNFDSVQGSAIISIPSGIGDVFSSIASITVLAITPRSDPVKNNWFIICQDVRGTQTGWALIESPLTVQPMKEVSIVYPRLVSVVSQTSFTLSNDVHVTAGGMIQVIAPPEFVFDCSTFRKVTLPYYPSDAITACTSTVNASFSGFELTLIQDLVPGTFSFCITGTMPSTVAGIPRFSMIIFDKHRNVVDSNMGFTGGSLLPSTDSSYIFVQTLTGKGALTWYPSPVQGASQIDVELRFDVIQQINLQSDGLTSLAAIRVSFPATFVSAVQLASDVIDTSDTPIMASVDFSTRDGLLIILNNAAIVTSGTYGVRFPVYVPATIPEINIWFLSFCSSNNFCTSINDTSVIASLPVGGFAIGDSYTLTLSQTISGTQVSFSTILSSFLMLLLSLFLNY